MRFIRRDTPRSTAIRGEGDMPVPSVEVLRARLDALAAEVASALDRGCHERAWSRTRALEREVDPDVRVHAEPVPPAPVIGRRFAAAHRRLLRAARATAAGRAHPAA